MNLKVIKSVETREEMKREADAESNQLNEEIKQEVVAESVRVKEQTKPEVKLKKQLVEEPNKTFNNYANLASGASTEHDTHPDSDYNDQVIPDSLKDKSTYDSSSNEDLTDDELMADETTSQSAKAACVTDVEKPNKSLNDDNIDYNALPKVTKVLVDGESTGSDRSTNVDDDAINVVESTNDVVDSDDDLFGSESTPLMTPSKLLEVTASKQELLETSQPSDDDDTDLLGESPVSDEDETPISSCVDKTQAMSVVDEITLSDIEEDDVIPRSPTPPPSTKMLIKRRSPDDVVIPESLKRLKVLWEAESSKSSLLGQKEMCLKGSVDMQGRIASEAVKQASITPINTSSEAVKQFKTSGCTVSEAVKQILICNETSSKAVKQSVTPGRSVSEAVKAVKRLIIPGRTGLKPMEKALPAPVAMAFEAVNTGIDSLYNDSIQCKTVNDISNDIMNVINDKDRNRSQEKSPNKSVCQQQANLSPAVWFRIQSGDDDSEVTHLPKKRKKRNVIKDNDEDDDVYKCCIKTSTNNDDESRTIGRLRRPQTSDDSEDVVKDGSGDIKNFPRKPHWQFVTSGINRSTEQVCIHNKYF